MSMFNMNHLRRFDPIAFRRACARSGFTSESLARAAGISAGYAAHVRCGSVPGEEIRARLAAALGLGVDDLWPLCGESLEPMVVDELLDVRRAR